MRPNRTEVRIQLAPSSSPVRTIAHLSHHWGRSWEHRQCESNAPESHAQNTSWTSAPSLTDTCQLRPVSRKAQRTIYIGSIAPLNAWYQVDPRQLCINSRRPKHGRTWLIARVRCALSAPLDCPLCRARPRPNECNCGCMRARRGDASRVITLSKLSSA